MTPFKNKLWGSIEELFGSYDLGEGNYSTTYDGCEATTYNRPEAISLCAVGFVEASFGRIDALQSGSYSLRNVAPNTNATYITVCCSTIGAGRQYRATYQNDYELLEDLTIASVLSIARDIYRDDISSLVELSAKERDNNSCWVLETWSDNALEGEVKEFLRALDQHPLITEMRAILLSCANQPTKEHKQHWAGKILDMVDGHLILHNKGTVSLHPRHYTRLPNHDIRGIWCDYSYSSNHDTIDDIGGESYQAIKYYQCFVTSEHNQPILEKHLVAV